MRCLVSSALVAASFVAPASAQVADPVPVRLELGVSGLWQMESGEHGIYRTGPGAAASVALRVNSRLAIGTEIAWIRTQGDVYEYEAPIYRDETETIGISASLLWHLSRGRVQPYVGIGAAWVGQDVCSHPPSYPAYCINMSGVTPVLHAGIKFFGRHSLLAGPELRLDSLGIRAGFSVVWFRPLRRGSPAPPRRARRSAGTAGPGAGT